MNAYVLVIAASTIIIVSYFFNLIAKRTNIPSVLMLIGLGILIQEGLIWKGLGDFNWFPYLEVLGIVGLIMIVLEAALDLELTKEKRPLIIKSMILALLGLLLTAGGVTYLLKAILQMDFTAALLYAIPMSVMSSAIVIPSVINLHEEKREFMIYESTFSDIFGIMLFYFIIGGTQVESAKDMWIGGGINILITIVISFVASYGLIILFQKVNSHNKLFLLIAVLLLMYSVAKLKHLSPLLIILVFGLIMRNRKLFFRGKLANYTDETSMIKLFDDLYLITMESSFVVRTFFFVIFGITISLASLFKLKVLLIALAILAITYIVRFILLKLVVRKEITPQLFLAPRGLITVLLYYAIPQEFRFQDFDEGILLFVILITSITMATSLIRNKKKEKNKENVITDNTESEEKTMEENTEESEVVAETKNNTEETTNQDKIELEIIKNNEDENQ